MIGVYNGVGANGDAPNVEDRMDLFGITQLCIYYSNDQWRYSVVGVRRGKPVIRISLGFLALLR